MKLHADLKKRLIALTTEALAAVQVEKAMFLSYDTDTLFASGDVALPANVAHNAHDMRLFNAIVSDVWKERQAGNEALKAGIERRIKATEERLETLEQAFIFDKAIDRVTYEQQRDRLRQEATLLQIEMHD